MRIARVAPLAERGVAALTEELVRPGHAVTLFASGASATTAELMPITDRALRLDSGVRYAYAYTIPTSSGNRRARTSPSSGASRPRSMPL